MDKYDVKLYSAAYRNIDEIYTYIADTFGEPNTAERIVSAFDDAIHSLEVFPERGAVLRRGEYANKGYRQLLSGNYRIIYRVLKSSKKVYIVTICHSKSNI